MEMTEEEIKAGNKLIAEYLGYIYYHPGVDIDDSDFGGIYTRKEVFSKMPIEVSEYPEDDQYYFKDLPNPDYGNKNSKQWRHDWKTLPWDTLNLGNYLTDLNYHTDWNELMPVVFKIWRETGYMIFFHSNVCYVQHQDLFTQKYNIDNIPKEKDYMGDFYSETPEKIIDAVWEAVVEFIKWKNKK